MPPAATTFYDEKVDRLYALLARIHAAFEEAGVEYRVVGGMAAYFHVTGIDPLAARLTRDVDIAVRRSDLERIASVASKHGFRYRHADGLDDRDHPMEQVHFVILDEVTQPAWQTPNGYKITPVADLVRMKLTSFRLKDKVHLQDLDGAGLTSEIEAALPVELRRRLIEVRAAE